MDWLISVWVVVAGAEIAGLALIIRVVRDITRPSRKARREAKNLDRELESISGR